jgi:hypothetical protein
MAKANKAQIEERISEVFTLIVGGTESGRICRFMSEKYNISTRTVERYIAEATERIIALSRPKQPVELGKAMARLENLYNVSYRLHDYRTCLSIQKEINTLLALYETQETINTLRLEYKRDEADPQDLTDDELRDILRTYARPHGSAGNGVSKPD